MIQITLIGPDKGQIRAPRGHGVSAWYEEYYATHTVRAIYTYKVSICDFIK